MPSRRTTFYLDLNQVFPEDPVEPMIEGRHLVVADTPDLAGGCHAVDWFVVA